MNLTRLFRRRERPADKAARLERERQAILQTDYYRLPQWVDFGGPRLETDAEVAARRERESWAVLKERAGQRRERLPRETRADRDARWSAELAALVGAISTGPQDLVGRGHVETPHEYELRVRVQATEELTRRWKALKDWLPKETKEESHDRRLFAAMLEADRIQAGNEKRNLDAQAESTQLVRLAQTDYKTDLMSVQAAMTDWAALFRHGRWLGRYGAKSSGVAFAILVYSSVVVGGLLFMGLLYLSPVPFAPWIPPILSFLLVGATYVLYWAGRKARQIMVRGITLERADPTDLTQVTGRCQTWLPRLGFLGRWEVWRGNGGNTGQDDQGAFVVLQCGRWYTDEPVTSWAHARLDRPNVPVKQHMKISELRTPLDYYGLPADNFTVRGESMVRRRLVCKLLDATGIAIATYDQNPVEAFIAKNWEWLVAVGLIIGTIVVFAMGVG